jgi:hypothetical protein
LDCCQFLVEQQAICVFERTNNVTKYAGDVKRKDEERAAEVGEGGGKGEGFTIEPRAVSLLSRT